MLDFLAARNDNKAPTPLPHGISETTYPGSVNAGAAAPFY